MKKLQKFVMIRGNGKTRSPAPKFQRVCLSLIPAFLTSFQESPWLPDLYEFHFDSNFCYSYYPRVQGAKVQLKNPSNDYLVSFDGGVSPYPSIDAQVEVQFAETPRQALGFRSAALLGRYLWFDDIAGDPFSLVTGLAFRGVSGRSLRDVSSPFHAPFNIEVNSAIGKEWASGADWEMRTFGLLGIGTGNRGYPWTRIYGEFLYNFGNHIVSCFTETYVGFGGKHKVDVDHFYGWGKYQHDSIDLGIKYTYEFEIWGSLSIAYDRRLFAKTFPQNWNGVLLTYHLPFSLF